MNAQDKGGLIPLHNASSYGHLDIAALLIKYNTVVNATDKWGFTPLHEAAQKGRTQLSALLVGNFFLPVLLVWVFVRILESTGKWLSSYFYNSFNFSV